MIRTGVPRGRPTITPPAPAPVVAHRAGGEVQHSRMGTPWRPSSAPEGSGADWTNAKRYFTFPSEADWVARFEHEPSTWTNLLGDIYRETMAERERRAGQARIGRRPRAIDGSMDQLWAMITPSYCLEPFGKALEALFTSRADISMNELAKRTKLARTTIRGMADGSRPLEMYRLEQIAKAFDVSPSYFREFRESYVLTVVSELLAAQPNLSIRFAKGITAAASKTKVPDRSAR